MKDRSEVPDRHAIALARVHGQPTRSGKQRASRVTEKQRLRRRGLKTQRAIPFAEIARHPLYQRIAAATCPKDLKAELKAYGCDNVAQVAASRSLHHFRQQLARASGDAEKTAESATPEPGPAFFARARREAIRCYRLMQYALATKEPMNQGLRHTRSPLPLALEQALGRGNEPAYAKPGSLQSNQSPAAYLCHLYRIATGLDQEIGIQPPQDGPYRLEQRRPDLAQLGLSAANLKQEIPTIVLVNEVLEAGLGDLDINQSFYPIALPFDEPAAITRAALAQIGGSSLNSICERSADNDFPLHADFRLAWDQTGLLGLTGTLDPSADTGGEIALLTESIALNTADYPLTLKDLYGTQDNLQACQVSRLLASFELDFDALAQLLGLYSVRQENGRAVKPKDFATFLLNNEFAPEIKTQDANAHVFLNNAPLQAPDLRALHYVARLHRAMKLDFHQLNWLLAIPGASGANTLDSAFWDSVARRHVSQTGARLLAGYTLYQQAFGLSPEAYAALFGEICPYWRADSLLAGSADTIAGLEQTEVSFMRRLFGDDAPWLHQTITIAEKPATDPELAHKICRGLGLSTIEFNALIEALDASFRLTTSLDARGLAALYRLTTVYRMLGWPLLSGLELTAVVSAQMMPGNELWRYLTAKNTNATSTAQLCTALDWLVALARWMQAAEISPETLSLILTPTAPGATPASAADRDWLNGLKAAIEPARANATLFRDFERWEPGDSLNAAPIEITGTQWNDHLTSEAPLYQASGIFYPGIDRQAIEKACRAYLVDSFAVDLALSSNHQRFVRLVTQLEKTRDNQAEILKSHVARLSDKLSITGATHLILWAQATPLDLLETLLAGADDVSAQFWLSELRRHVAAVDTLDLGDIDLLLVAERPEWLAASWIGPLSDTSAAMPLSLEQLFYLQRFMHIQVGAATDAAWLGYLALARLERPEAGADEDEVSLWRDACRETLAILLACPAEDVTRYIETLLGEEAVADDLRGILTVARHARLAEELFIGADELLALKAVSNSRLDGDWTAAAVAAQAGLGRFNHSDSSRAFHNELAEAKRDALVAAYLQTKIAQDPRLAAQITDREALYTYLLLDVNVSSAVPTSRLVEAISSLQLYITRALNDLEPGVNLGEQRRALAAQWQLDKSYRQWEANQKLQLYPQNYIEPELRYITSPEFDELLQAVSGNDISEDSVEAAINAYMADLTTSCELSLCSLFVERDNDSVTPANATYHFLARAHREPDRFFYRKLEVDYKAIATLKDPAQYLKALDWTYWQEIAIPKTYELLSTVTLCAFLGRLYFFWLEIEEFNMHRAEGDEVSWRIHPRYMRSDSNALTGTIHTPALFIEGQLIDSSAALKLDDAFVWSGKKPRLQGTNHPFIAVDTFVPGVVNATPLDAETRPTSNKAHRNTAALKTSEAQKTVIVRFGVELGFDQLEGEAQGSYQTSIQIRLSEVWSDAIYFLNTGVDTSYGDSAPEHYSCIHSSLRSEYAYTADQNTIVSHVNSTNLFGRYQIGDSKSPYSDVTLSNGWIGAHGSATSTFQAAPSGSVILGTIDTNFVFGDHRYTVLYETHSKVDKNGAHLYVKENTPAQRWVKLVLSQQNDDGTTNRLEGAWHTRQDGLFEAHHRVSFFQDAITSTDLQSDDGMTCSIAIPGDWASRSGKAGKIDVQIKAKISFGSIDFRMNYGGKNYTVVGAVNSPDATVEDTFHLGSYVLRPPEGKIDTAWAVSGMHRSRNFIHLLEHPDTPNNKSFVLLNSSPALSSLAQSMPRPGGATSLFTLENQSLAEDLGTFIQSFAGTLEQIYPNDNSTLDSARTPPPVFRFDGAYGGYGWEIFYHIPAAVAAGFSNSGQHEAALEWLNKIFDPSAAEPWRVLPLIGATSPEHGSAFDTGHITVDPDRIASDYPFYYQQATIRHYLEILLAAGDAAYEAQTQETLQQAKGIYVAAKQLFNDKLSETLEVLTNQTWSDPSLATAAADMPHHFLPPYNHELRELYDTIQERLSKLRQWLDINGAPLSVPLLSAPINPRILQQAAKSALALNSKQYAEEEREPLLDFPAVVRSAKGFIANLQNTSSRLLAVKEKIDSGKIGLVEKSIERHKVERSAAVQDLSILAAEKEVSVKRANLAAASSALILHVSSILTHYAVFVNGATIKESLAIYSYYVKSRILGHWYSNLASLKSRVPTIAGFAYGGHSPWVGEKMHLLREISHKLDKMMVKSTNVELKESTLRLLELTVKTTELSSKLAAANLELEKSQKALSVETRKRKHLDDDLTDMDTLAQANANKFTNLAFYEWLADDLAALFDEEWAATQDFCRLLIRLYEDETGASDGATLLRTSNPGDERERLNAPYWLALDIQRLEEAYTHALLEQSSQSSHMRFALSELPGLDSDQSALATLLDQGEVYFQLTDEMFDTYYPGQYDRRIQSVRLCFPGLDQAGLSPHARLTQIANTRYATRERNPRRGAKIRANRYALQSILIGSCEIDTATLESPHGLLRRFQNTGVESRWHLVLPSVLELKRRTAKGRNKAWRSSATRHLEALKTHLAEIEFEVRFSGRW